MLNLSNSSSRTRIETRPFALKPDRESLETVGVEDIYSDSPSSALGVHGKVLLHFSVL